MEVYTHAEAEALARLRASARRFIIELELPQIDLDEYVLQGFVSKSRVGARVGEIENA
ncbi:MAG: hypothetical protein O2895_01685 [Chloroflexi bacterium]|nr:hypothetical protein [Chloroflexota bacterium]